MDRDSKERLISILESIQEITIALLIIVLFCFIGLTFIINI